MPVLTWNKYSNKDKIEVIDIVRAIMKNEENMEVLLDYIQVKMKECAEENYEAGKSDGRVEFAHKMYKLIEEEFGFCAEEQYLEPED